MFLVTNSFDMKQRWRGKVFSFLLPQMILWPTVTVIVILLAGMVFYLLRKNRRMTRLLKEKNEELAMLVGQQEQQLADMAGKVRAGEEAGRQFFTETSQRLRGPLTLVLGPLEELQGNTRLPVTASQQLKLVHQHVMRLLGMVDELTVFRKDGMDQLPAEAGEPRLFSSAGNGMLPADPEKDVLFAGGGSEAPPSVGDRRCVLIVESDAPQRNFLQQALRSEYDVLAVDHGAAALEQAFDQVPDLIICDAGVQLKDGLSLTGMIKQDVRTAFIPVILLTVRTGTEVQLEGLRSLADVCMVKPFSVSFLKVVMYNLLRNRELLREHYTSELPGENRGAALKKPDRKFIHAFTAVVENNLSNEGLTIEAICTEIGVSRMQLYRKVKALLGCNINDYILDTRMRKAKYYLKEGELSIAEISYRVGFSSAAYFATVFKSRVNMTPKEYRDGVNKAV